MADETQHWLRQFVFLFLVAGLIQFSQAATGILLWSLSGSSVLLAFGLDSGVGALREFRLALGIQRHPGAVSGSGFESRVWLLVGAGYLGAGLVALIAGGSRLWQRQPPEPTLLGVALAAISVLLIPIVGSYMKAVAMELKSPLLKAAAIFTFSNSYLSMVLLISLLVRVGMEHGWGDPLGALVMAPFILQKGVQMLANPTGPVSEPAQAGE